MEVRQPAARITRRTRSSPCVWPRATAVLYLLGHVRPGPIQRGGVVTGSPGPAREGGSHRRSAGRHRPGRLPERVSRQEFDTAAIAQAAMLDQLEPGWVVWYGVYFRRFYAIALATGVGPLCIAARSCDALRTLMRESESSMRLAVWT